MKPKEPTVGFSRRLPKSLIDRMEAYVLKMRPHIQTVSQLIEIAIDEFLKRHEKD